MEDLRPGDIVNKAVEGRNGVVMLEAGAVLTKHYIERLRTLGFSRISIQARKGEGALAEEVFDPTVIDRMKDNEEERRQMIDAVRSFIEADRTFANLTLPHAEAARFRREFRERVYETLSQRPIAEELSVLRQTDPLWFEHALHVSLLANIAGDANLWDGSKLQELTVGSLLFDIGMTRLPQKLIRAKRKWTEEERRHVRQHTQLGYKVLANMQEVPLQAARAALLHHERYSGEGYPFAFKGKDIPELAQIIGLADVYDALLSPRHHRDPFPNNEAMEYLFAAGNYDFGIEIIQLFLKHVAVLPISSVVLLSSGQLGVVENSDQRPAHRPLVRIVREANGEPAKEPCLIDLSKHRQLVVVQTFPRGNPPA